MLKFEYSNYDDPSTLWKDLEIRCNNQREVLPPSARDEWNNLRFQDFKKINEYTSALYRICQTLRFYGQNVTEGDMLEKTFSTFHAPNINLQQQYRLQNFKRYSNLNVNLLVAKKNNDMLMKNHQSRPTRSLALPEANVVNNIDNKNSRSKRGRGNPRGRGPFPNRNYTYHRGGYNGRGRGQRNNTYHALQVNNFNQKNNKVGTSQNHEGSCFRCGSENHWSKACRIPSHLFKEKYCDPGIFSLWHDRLGHPGSTMMKRIVKNTHGHPLKDQKFSKMDKVPLCISCSLGKLIVRPLPLKIKNESPVFLERIQVYVPIVPPQRTKIGPQRRLGIYVGYETSSIIRYIEPLTAVDVDDLNIIGTNKEINEVIMHLKEEFEMKDLDADYLSDPHKDRSQSGYVFLNKGTAISQRSKKQTLVATSSNHAEVIALHEASRECVWLRSMTQLIVTSCGLKKEESPTLIYEDNAACVTQMK
uniref:CCHC-type domain-containing protein n=1 Tax=Tanacetum cinerariifolium TaxID=118510 RepID=A0A6L2LGV7_TANCI|nr:hypothetical protein [Tanacetum cinerariifolium]